ncbi:MAG: class I SAM-dependent methyltransferase [Minisyncoccia bacterium]
MEKQTDAALGESSDGAVLQRMYRARFEGRLSYRNEVWQALIKNYFQRFVRPQDAVLDLGAGYGEFINNIACEKKYALDLNPETVRRVNSGVQVLAQDCSKPWPLPDNALDVVFTSNFFEHLPHKKTLALVLAEARRCLKPSGLLIALGPNVKHLPGAYWDFLDHYIPLTELSLSEAFTQQGFGIEKCVEKFLPFTMVNGPHYPVIFIEAYLHFPPAWRILGKQFLVIGKKD